MQLTNLQLYVAIGLPTVAVLASLTVSLLQIMGIRDDIRELRADMREIRSDIRNLTSKVADIDTRLTVLEERGRPRIS
jgi:hypothetical protein